MKARLPGPAREVATQLLQCPHERFCIHWKKPRDLLYRRSHASGRETKGGQPMRHLWALFIYGVCMLGVVVPVGAQGNLEIPASGSLQSGIGFIAGWRCKDYGTKPPSGVGKIAKSLAITSACKNSPEVLSQSPKAGTLTFTIDNGPAAPLSYGISRGDTQNSCGGDINNGFIAEENWYFAGDGQHTIRVFDNSVQFAEATFTVTTLGGEFLKDLSGVCEIKGFPQLGKEVALQWQESNQNFVIANVSTSTSLVSCPP